MLQKGRNKTPPRGKTPPKKPPKSTKPAPKEKEPPQPRKWLHEDKLHLILKVNTEPQLRELLSELSVDQELASSTEVNPSNAPLSDGC